MAFWKICRVAGDSTDAAANKGQQIGDRTAEVVVPRGLTLEIIEIMKGCPLRWGTISFLGRSHRTDDGAPGAAGGDGDGEAARGGGGGEERGADGRRRERRGGRRPRGGELGDGAGHGGGRGWWGDGLVTRVGLLRGF
ncbi:Os01g0926350, partial [Oryza sativa Japonica Group]